MHRTEERSKVTTQIMIGWWIRASAWTRPNPHDGGVEFCLGRSSRPSQPPGPGQKSGRLSGKRKGAERNPLRGLLPREIPRLRRVLIQDGSHCLVHQFPLAPEAGTLAPSAPSPEENLFFSVNEIQKQGSPGWLPNVPVWSRNPSTTGIGPPSPVPQPVIPRFGLPVFLIDHVKRDEEVCGCPGFAPNTPFRHGSFHGIPHPRLCLPGPGRGSARIPRLPGKPAVGLVPPEIGPPVEVRLHIHRRTPRESAHEKQNHSRNRFSHRPIPLFLLFDAPIMDVWGPKMQGHGRGLTSKPLFRLNV